MKYALYILILVVAVAALIVAYKFGGKSAGNTTNNFTIIKPTETFHEYHNIPATSSTNAEGHQIASVDTTLESKDKAVKVRLGVDYDKTADTFGIDALIEQHPVKPKPKLFGYVAGVGIGFADSLKLHDAELSAGVEMNEKYSLSAFGRTDKTYGLRFGVRF